MFSEFAFPTVENLPPYIFAQISALKLAARQRGEDVIDLSMGNPDGPTPAHIVDKLCESALRAGTAGYSASAGITHLRRAICEWYERKYGVVLDPETEAVATMGSKEGFVSLTRAVINPGDPVLVPGPAYPIHTQAFGFAGARLLSLALAFDEDFRIDEEAFFTALEGILEREKIKFLVVNFPHNPSSATVEPSFYERLVALARQRRFYVISDIAYAELAYGGYTAPSILAVPGAKDLAVEAYTLSKTYNMAGWRVGFIVGNARLVGALKKIKTWFDYGMYTPIQVAAIAALRGDQACVDARREIYTSRMRVLVESFAAASWPVRPSRASMFIWAKLPPARAGLGSLDFAKELLEQAQVAVSPGLGFGPEGEGWVRIALIENENRIRQAAKNIKKYLKARV